MRLLLVKLGAAMPFFNLGIARVGVEINAAAVSSG
jgi:hypothetical protein